MNPKIKNCIKHLLSLHEENLAISQNATDFYHKKMSGCRACTYKHAANLLMEEFGLHELDIHEDCSHSLKSQGLDTGLKESQA